MAQVPLNSTLIRNYIKASQQIDLQAEVDRQAKITGITKKRELKKKDVGKKQVVEQGKDSIKDLDQHRLTWKQLCARLNVEENSIFTKGLTSADAAERNLKEGDNVLTQKKLTPWWVKLLKEWTSPFGLLLWGGSLLCFIAYVIDSSDPSNVYLGIVLALVVVVTGLVTYIQNSKSESVMAGFKNFIPDKCKVLRDGKEDEINSTKLVKGDVVVVVEGGRIPADIRIIDSKDMRVDNSSLTGESEPLLRSSECTEPEKILETKNIAFFGTMCKAGRGRGLVFNIGDGTVIGQIANMADTATMSMTPLRIELNRFINIITGIALFLGIVFFALGFALRYNFLQNLVFAIGIIVANVPEGLLATITITLSVASAKMHAKKVLVKDLESVETLGSTSCICSDKTGTLTQNKMTIENLFYDGQIWKAPNKEKMGPKFTLPYDIENSSFKALRDCAIVVSETTFSSSLPDKYVHRIDALNKKSSNYDTDRKKIEKEWELEYKAMPYFEKPVSGSASETAIIKFFQPVEDILLTRARFPVGIQKDGAPSIVPFNSAHKFSLKVAKCKTANSDWCVFISGAPERVWDKCSHVLYKDREIPLDASQKKLINDANINFAKGGQRILGFGKYHLPRAQYPENYQFMFKGAYDLDIPMDKLIFVGLCSLIDPPRDSVPDAIKKCKTAGIKVIMVTGDQQLTAAAIAKTIGIFEEETSVELAERIGCSYDEAVDRAQAIVVNGEMLTMAYQEDEGLPEKMQGKKLERWLRKPQIVFARTSPAQKLYIVKGCQKLGYIVAVTGDGVNDSPAINQADIGIAMGLTGSDVAKDSADMVLLNDDFSSIIMGIEAGRTIFDNLKKSISYTIASNIPEIIPFLALILIQIPLSLSTVLMLCVDLGTDMVPAVSFSFEEPELDIMTRKPRRKDEHMVTTKMMVFSYGQMGIMETYCGFVAWIVVLFDFGFNVYQLFGVVLKEFFPHNDQDIYDPAHRFLGNTNVKTTLQSDGSYALEVINPDNTKGPLSDNSKPNGARLVDWLYIVHKDQDLRMGYIQSTALPNMAISSMAWSPCRVYQISSISNRPICYTTEANRYGQTAFFFATVLGQFYNSLGCKTRKISLKDQGLKNVLMLFGWTSEFSLCLLLGYIQPINNIFGTRDLILPHAFLPGVPSGIMMVFWDECRKFLIRHWPTDDIKHPNWFERNVLY